MAHRSFDPGNIAYNIPETFVFSPGLDLEIFQRTVDLLLARHEILRTGFHEEEGELFQVIAPIASTKVGCTDLRSLSESEITAQGRKLVRELSHRPFDLQLPPLLRFHILRVAPNHDVLFMNVHHIIADLQALSILREELMVFYRALLANADACST